MSSPSSLLMDRVGILGITLCFIDSSSKEILLVEYIQMNLLQSVGGERKMERRGGSVTQCSLSS